MGEERRGEDDPPHLGLEYVIVQSLGPYLMSKTTVQPSKMAPIENKVVVRYHGSDMKVVMIDEEAGGGLGPVEVLLVAAFADVLFLIFVAPALVLLLLLLLLVPDRGGRACSTSQRIGPFPPPPPLPSFFPPEEPLRGFAMRWGLEEGWLAT